jgi:hypothetical protein
MPAVRPLEVKALLPLLEEDWTDTVNEKTGKVTPGVVRLATALIQKLDEVRADRTSYIAVIQIGGKNGFYVGIGPYPGESSAMKALLKHPVMQDKTLATGAAIVPVESQEGFENRLKEIDQKPQGNAA